MVERTEHFSGPHYALEAGENVAGSGVKDFAEAAKGVERVEGRAKGLLVGGGGSKADNPEVLEAYAELPTLDIGLVEPTARKAV